jgi:hypothetical protein
MEWNEVLIINKKYKISKLKLFGYATAHNYDVSSRRLLAPPIYFLQKQPLQLQGVPKMAY